MKIRLFALSFTSLLALALGSACTVKTVGTGGSGNTGNTGTGNNGNTGNVAAVCGNGACEVGENSADCPEDCIGDCGDGTCSVGEDGGNCAADCYLVDCGDGTCNNLDEDEASCPEDCGGAVDCFEPYPNDGCQRCGDAITFPTAEGCQVCEDPSAGLLTDLINCICGECAAECADSFCVGILPEQGTACNSCGATATQAGGVCNVQYSDCTSDI